MTAVTHPFTTVMTTYNLWGGFKVAEREPALRAFFTTRSPDILVVQELRPQTQAIIDETLVGHDRVHDEFAGWAWQGNIWWDRKLYGLEEHGATDIGIRASDARLFWARLATPVGRLLVATAHYTWPGHPQEVADELNPRTEQARRTADELTNLAGTDACVFAGDLNDYARPLWALRDAGFTEAFGALGGTSPPTHPAVPDGWTEEPAFLPATKAIDWQFHRGPVDVRSAEVVEFFHRGKAPSDHKPVAVTYTITGS